MIDGPIRRRNPALSFDELAELRDLSRQILVDAVVSLNNYRDAQSGGYFHVLAVDAPGGNAAGDFSKASTATVVPFLVRTGRWEEAAGDHPDTAAANLAAHVLTDQPWTSAGLPDDNPFTVGFLLELVGALLDVGVVLSAEQNAICSAKLDVLKGELDAGDGRVSIQGELPNSYLTQLATRVLLDWEHRPDVGGNRISDALAEKIWNGAIASVHSEIAVAYADPSGSDAFELGYAVLLANTFGRERLRPEARRMLRHGLQVFFSAQRDDGSWPRGRRLFSYPLYGNAYCYEFEFLTQLLVELADGHVLLPYLGHLSRAIVHLTDEAVELPGGGYGWASGHHRQLTYPESWSTASGFQVAHLVDRLVAEAVTDAILVDLGEPRLQVTAAPSWDRFDAILDSPVNLAGGETLSAKSVLRDNLLEPVRSQRQGLLEGKELAPGTPMSAILYGPPGTSKTTYARAMARALGWQLISIDPSHLLRRGFDQLQAETSRLFRMLSYAERVVVFFDEIDELVRDRFGEDEEATSRFLTTSMLPRIVRLRESRRVLFVVATNHLEVFDAAIARPGRFDVVLPVMPPSADAKLTRWPQVKAKMDELNIANAPALEQIGVLTYAEYASIVDALAVAPDQQTFAQALEQAANRGTLAQQATKEKTWTQLMDDQKGKIRTGA